MKKIKLNGKKCGTIGEYFFRRGEVGFNRRSSDESQLALFEEFIGDLIRAFGYESVGWQ